MLALDTATHSDFSPCIGEAFRLLAAEETVLLTLTEARVLGPARPGIVREPFVVTFHAPHAIRLGQGVFPLKHDSLGNLELFLVQTSPDEVEAVFN